MTFFNDVLFPIDISHGSLGGPGYSTAVVATSSGHESRNQNWVNSRCAYDVAYGTRTISQLESIIQIFHAVKGRAHSFRYKDFFDYKSTGVESATSSIDQAIGVGDGIETEFQLIKNYTAGTNTTSRDITKPVQSTVVIAVDGVTQTLTTDYTVDDTTGIISFVVAPADTLSITAGYEFDVPVRFNVDYLPATIDLINAGSMEISLIEVRE